MIYLKTYEDIERMREANTLVSRTLGEIAKWVAPGVTTLKLDTIAREFICDNGGRPACLGYGGFPGTICCEVNEIVVHGFPSNYTLREGDILGTDCVVEKDGFMGDSCYTFAVGEIAPEVMKLCVTTKESLYKGIEACQEGKRIGDIANAVQSYCEMHGYSVVREMCGHGIGKSMHEDPEVPNYVTRQRGPVLRAGMTLAVEPMLNLGSKEVSFDDDGWTARTKDGEYSAQYENTIAICDGMCEILTLPGFDWASRK